MASWLANRNIYNLVRQFDTSGGADMWERIGADVPPLLMGRPALEAEAMDSGFDASATANNYLAVFGDFENYVIADRVGMSVEFIPHLMGANQRPAGKRGWYAWYRVGADSVNDAAFRLLNVATTA
jgi:HK97 family phage major capsid protein